MDSEEGFYSVLHQKTAQDIDDILKMLVEHSQAIVNFQDAQNRNILHFVSIPNTTLGFISLTYRF